MRCTHVLRVGTCGGMQENILGGDLVIANGAIRMEGTSREYAPVEYPAVPDFTVTTALVQAAKNAGYVIMSALYRARIPFSDSMSRRLCR